jgi:membrane fusion protein (multidrug efflux system)
VTEPFGQYAGAVIMDDQTTDLRQEHTGSRRSAPARRSWVKRIVGGAVGAVVVIGLITGGTMYWLSVRNFETTDDAEIDAYTTQIAPSVSGQITKLLFSDNQHVASGQVLALIDSRDYQAKLEQAQAQQASAAASLKQAQAQVLVQQANVDQLAANVRVAEADLMQAQQDYQRFQAINPHAVTRQQVDASTASFHSAQAKLDASRQSVVGARAQVEAAQAQVVAAEAQVKQAKAATAAAELQLSYCTVIAPVAGIVTHRSVDVGNYVTPGQPLFALVQDARWVTANFKETQLASIRPGQAVDITIDAVPSITFHGKVDSFQGGTGSAFSTLPAENATGNYVKIVQRLPVKIVFDDPRVQNYPLMPGMSAEPSVRVR